MTLRLRRKGLTVERLPFQGPILAPSRDGNPLHVDAFYLTPTNGLLLPVNGTKRVLLPTAHLPGRTARFEALRKKHEQVWMDFFRARGWTPQLVEPGELAPRSGLLRCATATVPELGPPATALAKRRSTLH